MTSALSAEQRTSLERLMQDARQSIEEDLERALEGKYGINADGRIEAQDTLALSNAESAVRTDLVEIVEYLRSEGEDAEASVARLVREAAFTHTNRLIAVRVAEAIGLLPETMARGVASTGFRDFAELAPTVAVSEWGRFAEFVRLCADELATDVPALFDPRNPLIALEMSEAVLADVVEAISSFDDDLWAAPDTFGWAYQFFNTGKERKEMRDSGGMLVLPLIAIERMSITKDPTRKGMMPANIRDNPDEQGGSITIARRIKQDKTAIARNAATKRKWSGDEYSGDGQKPAMSNRFKTQKQDGKVIYETITMPMPSRIMLEYKLSDKDASALISEPSLCRFFESCVCESNNGSESAKWILNAGAKLANEQGCDVDELGISAEQLAGIIVLRKNNSRV